MQAIGFIGSGNMAEAIIRGLRAVGISSEIRVTNRSNKEKLRAMSEQYEIKPSNFEEVVKESEIILLAVKPKDIMSVLNDLQKNIKASQLLITVAAGIPMKTYETILPGIPVVRAMPNTSSAVLSSMTGLVKGGAVQESHQQQTEAIFQAVGKTLWIQEEQMNALTAISGSGPAYFYLFTETLIQAGVNIGLSEENAEMLAKETLFGVSQMLKKSGKSPARLREEVTSPKGTTLAALNVFWEKDLQGIVTGAAKACQTRAEEMEREYQG
ncbi:pyrroline-5-carboxylate reductase [Desulfitobacterium sp.]|uniref:pyrroline-5-carboxylate reductase n=1 Tax=Desulfitobacterium sp. TaxID=49981 RepID=UPI002B2053F4|nr:pyrroline-5-carboxylate reductase [Desulfitobacterium sp.]MEA4900806.1 pyrroline-5-carboxylate reductase [Desulfitobacterium sp.]